MWKRTVTNTAIQTVAKGVMIIIALITTGVLTRKLGVSVYGDFVLLNSVFLLLDAVADMGTKIIGVREAAAKMEKKEEDLVYRKVWKLRLFTTLFAFGLGLIFISNWEIFSEMKWEALVALSMMWLTMLAGNLEIVFQKRLRMDLKTIMDVTFPLLFMAAILFWPYEVTLLWAVSGYLVARLLSLMVGRKLILKIGGVARSQKISKKDLGEFFKMSWPMGVYLLIFTAYDRAIDSLMIRHFWSAVEVAWYGLAYKIYGNLLQPAYFFVSNIFPLLSAKKGDKNRLLGISTGILAGGGLAVAGIVWLLAPWMVGVLAGNGYEPSVGVLRVLVIALIFSYLGHLTGFTLISLGGQKEMLVIGVAVLMINLLLNWWTIPRFGIAGAAGVTAITELSGLLLMALRLRRRKMVNG